jgi:hypothetical protein
MFLGGCRWPAGAEGRCPARPHWPTRRWRSPLQDFLQVKVGAKALDIGEDPCPCESQELPALGVDELLDFGQSFSQLAEEVDDRTIVF